MVDVAAFAVHGGDSSGGFGNDGGDISSLLLRFCFSFLLYFFCFVWFCDGL
ncbi:hypothetical protein A2U01_0008360, partial [Trifolium medium]|nr:hypothetical protein [Trifolium medium]